MIIERKRGDTYDVVINITDTDGVYIPLTSESFTLSVDSTVAPVGAPDTFTVAGVVTDSLTGEVSFPIAGTTAAGDYFFDIEMTGTDTKIRTILCGQFNLTQDITK